MSRWRLPLSHVIYTVLGLDRYGKDLFILEVPSASVNGIEYKNCELCIDVPYTNLLAFSFDDFKTRDLEALSFIYLYRYMKDKKKFITNEGMKEVLISADIVSDIIKHMKLSDRELLAKPIYDLLQDINNEAVKNNVNEEVVEMLVEKSKTYSDLIEEKGIEKGIEKGKLSMVMGMIEEGVDLNTISRVAKLNVETIKKIAIAMKDGQDSNMSLF